MTRQLLSALVIVALWPAAALADTPPARAVNSLTYDAAGNAITSTVSGGKRGLDCNVSNALAAPGNFQVVSGGAAIDPRAVRALTTSDQVSCAQLGSWSISGVSGTVSLPTNAAQESGGNLAAAASSAAAINGKISAFDLDSGAGAQNVQGVNLRFAASGGSVQAGSSTDPLRVDPTGSTVQPVSLASVPLPTGAATSALQTAGNASLSSVDAKLNNTTGGALKTDSSAFTQPISAAALPLPTGASTAANQTTSNNTLANINAKLFTNGTNDAAKVDGSSFTQPVSGSVSALQSGTWTVQSAQSGSWTVAATQSGTWNVTNISGTVSLPTGAATSANQTTTNSTLATINGKLATLGQKTGAGSMPVVLASDQGSIPSSQSGAWVVDQGLPASTGNAWPTKVSDGTNTAAVKATLTSPLVTDPALVVSVSPNSSPIASTQSGTWNITNVTGTVSLPTGAATSAAQATGNASLSSIDTKTPALASGRVPVDGSGVTQPISAAALPLPSGAATAAKQPALGAAGTASADVLTVQGISSMTPLLVNGSGVTQPVSGTVTANQGGTWNVANITGTVSLPTGASTSAAQTTGNASLSSIDGKVPALGQTTMAASTPVTIASNQTALPVSQSGTWNVTNISGTVSLPTGASTSALQTSGNASLSSIDGKVPALVSGRTPVDGSGVTQPISAAALPLPAGAATSAAQGTGNASVASIDGKTPALGQAAMAASSPVVIASNQTSIPVTLAAGSVVSTANSSTTPLGSNGVFTGTAEDLLAYPFVTVSVIADVASAANGLQAQWSSNGTNWDVSNDMYSIPAATGKTFTFGRAARFFRLVYTNGVSAQATFRLQTIVQQFYTKPSSHKASESLPADTDTEVVKSVTTAQDPTGAFLPVQMDANGGQYASQVGRTSVATFRNDYSTGNVTTAAFTTVIASTSGIINEVSLYDSSGQTMRLNYAASCGALAAGSNEILIPRGGSGSVSWRVPAAQCVGLQAVSANAVLGEFDATFLR